MTKTIAWLVFVGWGCTLPAGAATYKYLLQEFGLGNWPGSLLRKLAKQQLTQPTAVHLRYRPEQTDGLPGFRLAPGGLLTFNHGRPLDFLFIGRDSHHARFFLEWNGGNRLLPGVFGDQSSLHHRRL